MKSNDMITSDNQREAVWQEVAAEAASLAMTTPIAAEQFLRWFERGWNALEALSTCPAPATSNTEADLAFTRLAIALRPLYGTLGGHYIGEELANDIVTILDSFPNAPTHRQRQSIASSLDSVSTRPTLPVGDEVLTCVHCGMELGASIGGGLFTHANNLQRCQEGAPYGHMGHPAMPCPSGTVNDCSGSREENCDHLASRPSSPQAGDVQANTEKLEPDSEHSSSLVQAGDELKVNADAPIPYAGTTSEYLVQAADERGKIIAEVRELFDEDSCVCARNGLGARVLAALEFEGQGQQ